MTKQNLVKTLVTKDFGIVNEDEQIVEGIVTDDSIDIDGHIIDQDGFKSSLVDYLQWGNVRDQHGLPVGKVLEIPEWNKFVVKIVDDAVWKKIKNGLYKGFSIGIRVLDFEIEDAADYGPEAYRGVPQVVVDAIKAGGMIFRITKMVLAEVSIVDRPANPRALITAFKSMDNKDAKLLPVMGVVLEAQKQYEGDNTMAKKTQPVVDEATEQTVEQEVTNTEVVVDEVETKTVDAESVEAEVVAEDETQENTLEAKFASLEAKVNELTESYDGLTKQMGSMAESMLTITEALDTIKNLQTQVEAASESVEDEVEEVAEEKTVEAEQTKTLDIDELLAKLDERIQKSVGDILEKKLGDENDGRIGGVNLGEAGEEKSAVEKNTRKATYSDAARAFAAMLQTRSNVNAN